MIKEECKRKLLADLKHHTQTTYEENVKSKMPFIRVGEGEWIRDVVRDHKDYHEIDPKIESIDEMADRGYTKYARHTLNEETNAYVLSNFHKIRFHNVRYFHYNDTWYSYKYSVDEPEFTFGILKVENMPYITFEPRMNVKSFIATATTMVWQRYVSPFMLFINGEFVDCNDISIVYDAGDTYFIVYSEKYTWYEMEDDDIHMVILPFAVEYYSKEDPNRWSMMYTVLKDYIQQSMRIENDVLKITVPGVDEIHEYRGMIYHVGGWLYQQYRNAHLGLLTDAQINELKNITVRKNIYDSFGNIIETKSLKFNAFDKDSYHLDIYREICHGSKEYYEKFALFRFDDNGILDNQNGQTIISLIDGEEVLYKTHTTNEKDIRMFNKDLPMMYRENHLVFNCGLYDPRFTFENGNRNTTVITIGDPDHETGKLTTVYMFYIEGEYIENNNDKFYDEYFNGLLDKYFENPDDPSLEHIKPYLEKALESLDFEYRDDLTYDENVENAYLAVLKYNPMLFNRLYHTCIHSTVYDGKYANEALMTKLAYEDRKGLKISRARYRDHESYCMVFLNGELLPEYWNMGVYPNFFFIPRETPFKDYDKLEILYFDRVDNNEIPFNIVPGAVEEIEDGVYKWKYPIDTNTFIPKEELKIFCLYPKDALVYPEQVPESDDIAFNVSGWDGEDFLFVKNTVKTIECDDNHMLDYHPELSDRTNTYVAVSSHKFIYQRLYVDQKAYRLKLDRRFRYCDNQKQYALFINGRRMDDESFLVTIPKYTRPFWGMYIYLANFVMPSDRIEVFYLPEEFQNMWEPTIDSHRPLNTDGFIEVDRNKLETPYDPRYYMVFVNGKKILPEDLHIIDTHTLRFKTDPQSTENLVVIPAHEDTIPEIVDYMKSDTLSTYDEIIDIIRRDPELGRAELDRLFNIFVKMSNTELHYTMQNVARIAILNEIIRDFWVSSGFEYQFGNFVYDYQMDDFFFKNVDDQWMLPALDAQHMPDINIIKNDIHLVSYSYSCDSGNGKAEYDQNYVEETVLVEWGDVLKNLKFEWEYSNNLYTNMTHFEVYKQIMSYTHDVVPKPEIVSEDIPPERKTDADGNVTEGRSWVYSGNVEENMTFIFSGSTGFQKLSRITHFEYTSAVFYGNVDEDKIQHWTIYNGYEWLDTLTALVPKDFKYYAYEHYEQESPYNTEVTYKEKNYIIRNMGLTTEKEGYYIPPLDDYIGMPTRHVIMGPEDGIIYESETLTELNDEIYMHRTEDLQHMMGMLNKQLVRWPELDLKDYVIGNNNYFVFAAPYYMCFDTDGTVAVDFVMPDPWSDEIKQHVYNDKEHQTPIYTSGKFLDYVNHNLLEPIDKMVMEYLGEFMYVNKFGQSMLYSVWRTNGFYTRLFEDYGFDIYIRMKDGFYWDDGLGRPVHVHDIEEDIP